MIDFLKNWYNGKTEIQHFDELNQESSGIYLLPSISTEYHWTARATRMLVNFVIRHFQFILTTVIALAALYYTAIK